MEHRESRGPAGTRTGHRKGWATIPASAVLVALCGLLLISCATTQNEKIASAPQKVVATEPQLGAIKMINGIEYVYSKNRRWQCIPGEPEYVWVRKDLYSPRLFDSLKESATERKELDRMKERIEQLEKELNKQAG